ncbi:MAG: hypothetical protein M3Y30_16755, partial [Gemmatimonadota bacterium]|nr:hypothetical protein [Gemmatimonadota bacterium]
LESLRAAEQTDEVVLSGGVFQNELLLAELMAFVSATPARVSINRVVPSNDGGISLGQAALAIGASY